MENYKYLKDTCECSVRAEDISFSLLVNKFKSESDILIEHNTIISDSLDIIMHTHAYSELFICIEGSSSINTTSGCICLSSGDMLLIPPGIRHVKVSDTSKWASFGFTYHKLNKTKSNTLYNRLNRLCYSAQPIIITNHSKMCSEIYNLLCDVSKYAPEITALHMLDILLRINEAGLCNNSDGTILGNEHVNKKIDKDINRLSQLERIFELSFMQDIRPSEVAAQLFISERQLNRLIHTAFGTTFHKLVVQRRIIAATQMLENTELSVETICNAVGFNSKSVFYTSFKQQHGMTPFEFRKRKKTE